MEQDAQDVEHDVWGSVGLIKAEGWDVCTSSLQGVGCKTILGRAFGSTWSALLC